MKLLGALSLLAAVGCAARRGGSDSEGRFQVGAAGEGWERVDPGGADKAWYSTALTATIYADSNCDHRHDDSSLSDAMRHLTAGLRISAPLREEELLLSNRAALMRVYDVTLDGVPLRMGAVVLNKNACTYDMVYLAPTGRFEDGWSDFVAVVSGFEAQ